MPGLIIGWEYLTGRCVATDPANRQQAEWPPHPGRVFLALAATWFETGEDPAQGEALRWLETLSDPVLVLPPRDQVFPRSEFLVFVPVNDTAGPASTVLQSAPIFRTKRSRTFPSVWVGGVVCYLHWPNAQAEDVARHREALARLCGEVTRVGHSSSLVRMWVADAISPPHPTETWVPDDGLAELLLRSHRGVSIDRLPEETNIRRINEFARLEAVIMTASNAPENRKMRREAEAEYERIFGQRWSRRVEPPPLRRPRIGLWTGYRRAERKPPPAIPHTHFDTDLLVLAQTDGPRLPLASTLTVTRALRGAILAHIGTGIPDWVSGHKENGEPLRNGNKQLALVPLPFVGHEHADGHLLGVGLVFPREISRAERGRVLGPFLVGPGGEARDIRLTLGRLGDWTVRKRDWLEHRRALQPETWTAHPHGAAVWASVTPVVLDRFPKSDPLKERAAWETEVADILATACERLGLPRPVEIVAGTTSWHRGSPRSVVKYRPLRGHPELADRRGPLGDGFPVYPARDGGGPRPQVHVRLRFDRPVIGPILLGAGRFFGYGLCQPLQGEDRR